MCTIWTTTIQNKRQHKRLTTTTVTANYDEVRDVLDEEGGSDEDVDVGFFVAVPEVELPEVAAVVRLASNIVAYPLLRCFFPVFVIICQMSDGLGYKCESIPCVVKVTNKVIYEPNL